VHSGTEIAYDNRLNISLGFCILKCRDMSSQQNLQSGSIETQSQDATFSGTLITEALYKRPARSADYEAENHALVALAESAAASPQTILHQLVQTCLELCRADSAGISILEPHGETGLFRWRAIAGEFAPNLNGTMPRQNSPCGIVLDCDDVLLFDRPARHFPDLELVRPLIFENLLVPFHIDGEPAGTLWAIAHTPDRKFDAEDARLLTSLARFAAAAYQLTDAHNAAENQRVDHKKSEDALRESEERLQVLLESVQDYAIFTLTPNNRIDSWNPGAERIFGYTESEIIGQPGALLFTPEDQSQGVPEQELERARKDGRAIDERWHMRKDGRLFYASGVTTALHNNPQLGFVKVARDLTEQKRAQEALRASETRFRTLSDAVPQLIWTNTPDGYANYFNQRWYEYSGLTYEQSAGLGWQAMVHPDDAAGSIAQWEQALREGKVFDVEYRLRRADGAYRWQIGRNVPLYSSDGQVLGWFGTATDVEDLKRAEEAQRQAHDEMEARVVMRTAELQHLAEELRTEASERKDAEEQARVLWQQLVNAQEDERRRISRELHDQMGQQLTALLMGIKAVSEVDESGHHHLLNREQLEKLYPLAADLMQQMHNLAWELRPATLDTLGLEPSLKQYVKEWGERTGIEADFMSRGVSPSTRLPDEIETALYRVVQEALTNVQRHARARRVSVLMERRDGHVVAIVEDDGLGFDAELHGDLQIRKGRHRLGVLGMHERLELVGGLLTIESTPGRGTTIYARVPVNGGRKSLSGD
jgi:PAS domain S-box-containing protein